RMVETVFDSIRRACRSVAERAVHVRIQHGKIDEYARSLVTAEVTSPGLDPNAHFIGDVPGTVAFFLTLDAINFGSGYFPHLKKRPGMSGYFTVASSLTAHFRAHGPIPSHKLANLAADDCARIFGQDMNNPACRELMQLFSTALND